MPYIILSRWRRATRNRPGEWVHHHSSGHTCATRAEAQTHASTLQRLYPALSFCIEEVKDGSEDQGEFSGNAIINTHVIQ